MNTATIAEVVIAFAVYLIISQFYFKKWLHIKAKSTSIFHQDRNKISVAIDGGLVVMFIYTMFWVNIEKEAELFSSLIRIVPMFAFFFLLSLNRGIEEWLLHQKDKAYYHEWLDSFLYLSIFLIILLGER